MAAYERYCVDKADYIPRYHGYCRLHLAKYSPFFAFHNIVLVHSVHKSHGSPYKMVYAPSTWTYRRMAVVWLYLDTTTVHTDTFIDLFTLENDPDSQEKPLLMATQPDHSKVIYQNCRFIMAVAVCLPAG